MEVIRAGSMGMCFGVRDALEVIDGIGRPESVTIYGELVHNEEVLEDLDRRGFVRTSEARGGAVPATESVMITAHGISDRERARLASAGKALIDTTCPLVKRAHDAAIRCRDEGYYVVVIGKPEHVEVVGLVGDLDRSSVIPRPEDAGPIDADRIAILCQTTTPPSHAEAVRDAIVAANPGKEVRFVNTICRPTRERQLAARELIDRVEALVVVGGSNSNNTRQLVRLAQERGLPAFHVRGPDDLEPATLARYRTVGLTAGTSTLEQTIEAVCEALERIGPEAPEICNSGRRREESLR